MRVYVALYDIDFNFMVAQRRTVNCWWDRKVTPFVHVVDEAGTYCFPNGEKRSTETDLTAAERIYFDQTGYEIPLSAFRMRYVVGDGYALVCYHVGSLKRIMRPINEGLKPLYPRSPGPANTEVADWELEKVGMAARSELARVLGCEEPSQIDFIRYAGRANSVRRYKEMVANVKTIP